MDLEQLLARVAVGETEFRAGGDTPEAVLDFRGTVDAACQAFMRDYVRSLDTRWGDDGQRRRAEAVLVRELTENGRRFLDRVGLPISPLSA